MSEFVVPYSDPSKPRVAYNNLFLSSLGTVTVSSEAANYPHENAYDWNESSFWQPTGTGAAWLEVSFSKPVIANYCALHATTLAANAGQFDCQYSLDGGTTWLSALGGVVTPTLNVDSLGNPTGMPVQYKLFAPIFAAKWRFWMTSVNPSFVGVVSIGIDFECERGCWTGFVPPTLGRNTMVTNSQTVAGKFVGRSLLRKNISSGLNLEYLTEAWVRGTWIPFVISAEQFPFFVLWNDDNWPFEATFNWSAGNIPPPKNQMAGSIRYMSANINFDGNAEA
jgi:hypothetical protein